MNQLAGTVATWSDERGFGFVRLDRAAAGEYEVFCHASTLRRCGLPDAIAPGRRVVVDLERVRHGRLQVRRLALAAG